MTINGDIGASQAHMRPRVRTARLLTAPLLALASACSSAAGGPSLSVDDLRNTGESCPIDLAAAAVDAGLVAAGRGHVTVSVGSGDGGIGASALDRHGGVLVECTQPVAGGDVSALLLATREPLAFALLLPDVQKDLELTNEQLVELPERFDATDEGDLVDLGAEGPAAVAPLRITGATSSVLYVSAPEVASADQTRDMAEGLLDGL